MPVTPLRTACAWAAASRAAFASTPRCSAREFAFLVERLERAVILDALSHHRAECVDRVGTATMPAELRARGGHRRGSPADNARTGGGAAVAIRELRPCRACA